MAAVPLLHLLKQKQGLPLFLFCDQNVSLESQAPLLG